MKNLKKLNKPLLGLMIIFFIFGLIMIFSASSIVSVIGFKEEPYFHFMKQLLFIIIGIVAFFVVINVPIKLYKKISTTILIGLMISLFCLILYGEFKNSSKSWFDLGFISIQPSEFIKIVLILYLSVYYGKNKDNLKTIWDILKPLSYSFIIFILVFLQPDLGTGIIIFGISLFLFFALPIQGHHKKNMVILILVGTVLMGLLYTLGGNKLLSESQAKRLQFAAPCQRYQEATGYQVCNGFIAINGGGLTGLGFGNSTQKFLYLPEAHTDFIFPIIVEETGIIGGVLVIVGYMILLFLVVLIAKKANNLTNSMIAYGVGIYIFLHISINLVGVLGIGPLTGVPLPFLSYGGSYALSLFIALGLVQRVAIESKIDKNVQR